MREVVAAKDLAGITTAVQRARSVANAIAQTMEDEVQAAAQSACRVAAGRGRRGRRAGRGRRSAGKVITVFSTKGGVGKSLVATNLGVALADQGHNVCLVDLDVNSGDVAIMLQLTPHAHDQRPGRLQRRHRRRRRRVDPDPRTPTEPVHRGRAGAAWTPPTRRRPTTSASSSTRSSACSTSSSSTRPGSSTTTP